MSIKVFDFFSGCGGTSQGFQQAGLDVVFALDNDPGAIATYRKNFPLTLFVERDINEFGIKGLEPYIDLYPEDPKLFCGCAPCQPFSKQKRGKDPKDSRIPLLTRFSEIVDAHRPEYVFVENVPGMQKLTENEGPFGDFLRILKSNGYWFLYRNLASQTYGVPQLRRRLVLIASRLGPIKLPVPTHGPDRDNPFVTVRDAIGGLPKIEAGGSHPQFINHRSSILNEINLERIKATPEGGDRRNWSKALQLPCHSNGHDGHSDVYGRMSWDKPATGLTTRCISYSNGRFGHPEQDRAISVREAALLQTFPMDFEFTGSMNSMARQIGNAVPVKLAESFGREMLAHWKTHWQWSL